MLLLLMVFIIYSSENLFIPNSKTFHNLAPAAAADAPAKKEEKPKEEEVDALDGGMSMFGAPAGGGDY